MKCLLGWQHTFSFINEKCSAYIIDLIGKWPSKIPENGVGGRQMLVRKDRERGGGCIGVLSGRQIRRGPQPWTLAEGGGTTAKGRICSEHTMEEGEHVWPRWRFVWSLPARREAWETPCLPFIFPTQAHVHRNGKKAITQPLLCCALCLPLLLSGK